MCPQLVHYALEYIDTLNKVVVVVVVVVVVDDDDDGVMFNASF